MGDRSSVSSKLQNVSPAGTDCSNSVAASARRAQHGRLPQRRVPHMLQLS